jgi:hypothetical protein
MNSYNNFSLHSACARCDGSTVNMQPDAGIRRSFVTHAARTKARSRPTQRTIAFPYGDHIGRFGVCYRCHVMIHTRFKNPGTWARYKQDIRLGKIFASIGRSYPTFCWQMRRRLSSGHRLPGPKR